ncbi:PTS glucitol/sorbitol transporter subunit IIA [Ligilactobacillus sp. Marseille-Q7487]|jgi:PTS system glucitol/sorbitol-specific IIA component|uniref:PTS glucitol/sorbitol transporter subunit IIA n=1 Tax=Ligilactobacillus sp. Marseille-Q7487 TaxID=3022128 RepID=UPI0015B702C9|nr:PTS glucitol/sorbitol transporter subunit IIA [Ligilactobacillus sp. Marseille-Q7487]
MMKTKVLNIGAKALDEKDGLIILFGKSASPRLAEVSVIQEVLDGQLQADNLSVGKKILIDEQSYEIKYAGELVFSNLETVEHTVFDFNEVPENPRSNAIYLAPNVMPQVKEGSTITFGA